MVRHELALPRLNGGMTGLLSTVCLVAANNCNAHQDDGWGKILKLVGECNC